MCCFQANIKEKTEGYKQLVSCADARGAEEETEKEEGGRGCFGKVTLQ